MDLGRHMVCLCDLLNPHYDKNMQLAREHSVWEQRRPNYKYMMTADRQIRPKKTQQLANY